MELLLAPLGRNRSVLGFIAGDFGDHLAAILVEGRTVQRAEEERIVTAPSTRRSRTRRHALRIQLHGIVSIRPGGAKPAGCQGSEGCETAGDDADSGFHIGPHANPHGGVYTAVSLLRLSCIATPREGPTEEFWVSEGLDKSRSGEGTT